MIPKISKDKERIDLLATFGIHVIHLLYIRTIVLETYEDSLRFHDSDFSFLRPTATYYSSPSVSLLLYWMGSFQNSVISQLLSNTEVLLKFILPYYLSVWPFVWTGIHRLCFILMLLRTLIFHNPTEFRFYLEITIIFSLLQTKNKNQAVELSTNIENNTEENPASKLTSQRYNQKSTTSKSILYMINASIVVLIVFLVIFNAHNLNGGLTIRKNLKNHLMRLAQKDTLIILFSVLVLSSTIKLIFSVISLTSHSDYQGKQKKIKLAIEFLISLLSLICVSIAIFTGTDRYSISGVLTEMDRMTKVKRIETSKHNSKTESGWFPIYIIEAKIKNGNDTRLIEVNIRGKLGGVTVKPHLFGDLFPSRFTSYISNEEIDYEDMKEHVSKSLINLKHRVEKEGIDNRNIAFSFSRHREGSPIEQMQIVSFIVKRYNYAINRLSENGEYWMRKEDQTFEHHIVDEKVMSSLKDKKHNAVSLPYSRPHPFDGLIKYLF